VCRKTAHSFKERNTYFFSHIFLINALGTHTSRKKKKISRVKELWIGGHFWWNNSIRFQLLVMCICNIVLFNYSFLNYYCSFFNMKVFVSLPSALQMKLLMGGHARTRTNDPSLLSSAPTCFLFSSLFYLFFRLFFHLFFLFSFHHITLYVPLRWDLLKVFRGKDFILLPLPHPTPFLSRWVPLPCRWWLRERR